MEDFSKTNRERNGDFVPDNFAFIQEFYQNNRRSSQVERDVGSRREDVTQRGTGPQLDTYTDNYSLTEVLSNSSTPRTVFHEAVDNMTVGPPADENSVSLRQNELHSLHGLNRSANSDNPQNEVEWLDRIVEEALINGVELTETDITHITQDVDDVMLETLQNADTEDISPHVFHLMNMPEWRSATRTRDIVPGDNSHIEIVLPDTDDDVGSTEERYQEDRYRMERYRGKDSRKEHYREEVYREDLYREVRTREECSREEREERYREERAQKDGAREERTREERTREESSRDEREERYREERAQEDGAQEDRAREERSREEREERYREERAQEDGAQEDRAREERSREEREERYREKRTREDGAQEDRAREERSREDRDERSQEERAREDLAQEERSQGAHSLENLFSVGRFLSFREERYQEERAREDRAQDRAREKRTREERHREERAREDRAQEERSREELSYENLFSDRRFLSFPEDRFPQERTREERSRELTPEILSPEVLTPEVRTPEGPSDEDSTAKQSRKGSTLKVYRRLQDSVFRGSSRDLHRRVPFYDRGSSEEDLPRARESHSALAPLDLQNVPGSYTDCLAPDHKSSDCDICQERKKGVNGVHQTSSLQCREYEKPVTVEFKATFLKINDIDTLSQQFESEIYIQAKWEEPAFSGMPQSDLDLMTSDKLWDPMLVVSNVVGEMDAERRSFDLRYEYGYEAPVVVYRWRFKGLFRELLELKHFPFDVQDMTVHISTDRPVEEIAFKHDQQQLSTVNLGTFLDKQEWTLYNHVECSIGLSDLEYASSGISPNVLFICRVRRKVRFYVWNIVFIVFLIMMLSLMTMSVDPTSPDRLAYTITLFLTMVAFKLVIKQSLPCISYLTYLDIYVLFALIYLVAYAFENSVMCSTGRWMDRDRHLAYDYLCNRIYGSSLVAFHLYFVIDIEYNALRRSRLMEANEREYAAQANLMAKNMNLKMHGSRR